MKEDLFSESDNTPIDQMTFGHNKTIDEALPLLTMGGKGRYKGVQQEKKKNKSEEADIQKEFIIWLRKEYQDVTFRTDWFAGHYCPPYVKEQYINAQSGRSFPDIFIVNPSKIYHGLLIETKKSESEVYLKDGKTLCADQHIHDQYKEILKLRAMGHCASFGCGLDHMKRLTIKYFNNEVIKYRDVIVRTLNQSKYDADIDAKADEFFRQQGIG